MYDETKKKIACVFVLQQVNGHPELLGPLKETPPVRDVLNDLGISNNVVFSTSEILGFFLFMRKNECEAQISF